MLWVLALGVVRCWGGSLLGVVRVVAVDVVAVVAGVFWFVLSNNGGLFIHITYASTHVGVHTRELIRLTHSHMRSNRHACLRMLLVHTVYLWPSRCIQNIRTLHCSRMHNPNNSLRETGITKQKKYYLSSVLLLVGLSWSQSTVCPSLYFLGPV